MHLVREMDSTDSDSKYHGNGSLRLALAAVIVELGIHILHFGGWLPAFIVGVIPRTIQGLPGIIFAPWLHGSWTHLFSNSAPLFLAVWGTSYLYHRIRFPVLFLSMIAPGIAVWFWDDSAMHLGASGWIYALLAFIFWSGLFRRHPRSIALSLIIVFLYGGMVWQVLPLEEGVSWQSHLTGAIAGFLLAVIYRKTPIDDPEEIEKETEEYDDDFGYTMESGPFRDL